MFTNILEKNIYCCNKQFARSSSFYTLPSLTRGVARIFFVFDKLDVYKYSDNPDTELLANDWKIVGDDIRQTVKKYKEKFVLK